MEREKLIHLVTAAQGGDGEALNELFNAFYNDVYYFALKTVKDEDLACDITQESFVEIINTIGDLKEPAAFVKWMKQITYHQCTRYFKKKKDVLVDEDEEGNTIFDIVAEDRTEFIPDEALDQQDFKKTILSMLDELSEEQRAAVLMYYYDELSVKQIAEIQGVSEGTVKSRLNYARKSIKNSVETYEKKNNIKLHSFAFLPFMFWLLKTAAEDSAAGAASAAPQVAAGVSAATGTAITAGVATGTATAVAAGATTGAAVATTAAAATTTTATAAGAGVLAKVAAVPLAAKIIAGITAAAIAAGGVGLAINHSQNDPTEPTSAVVPSGTIDPSGPATTSQPSGTTQTTAPNETHEHTYAETVVEPTCTEQGYSIFTCQCGESYQGEFVAAWGHQWYDAEGMVTEEPTENTPGQRLYSCAICNYVYVEEIPPLGHEHNYVTVVTEPTCTEQGYTTYTCSCGDSYVGNYVSAYGHFYYPAEVVASTNEEQGYTRYKCISCEHSYEGDFVAIEPSSADTVVPEGCEYILADGETRLGPGESMPEISSDGDQLITPNYIYTCFVDAEINEQGWGVKVRDTHQESYPDLLSSVNGFPLTSMIRTFLGCSEMTHAPNIPETVTDLTSTFSECKQLTIVPDIPSNAKKLYMTFTNCVKLSYAPHIPEGVTDMTGAFEYCENIEIAPRIPDTVTTLLHAFKGCTSLTTVYEIPASVRDLRWAFADCESLEGTIVIHANPGWLYRQGCFEDTECEIKLTGTSTVLEELAATSSKGNVTVAPSSDTEVTYYVPENCTYILANGTVLDPGEAMPNVCTDGDQFYTEAYTYTYDTAWDGWKAAVNDTTLLSYPDLMAQINGAPLGSLNQTFHSCTEMTYAPTIPSSVTDMESAFSGCTKLVEMPEIPYGVMTLAHAFDGCVALSVLSTLPGSVQNLSYAFRNCAALTKTPNLPESVTAMVYAFSGCINLTEAEPIPQGVTNLLYAFGGCEKLKLAPELPDGLISLSCTFDGCIALKQAPKIPETVTIMTGSFRNCESLENAPVIPASVTNMQNTFYGCKALAGTIEIHASPENFLRCFDNTVLSITLTGTSTVLEELAATATNGNVKVE